MTNNILKVLSIIAVISVLSACSGGLTSTSCLSGDCQSPESHHTNTLKYGGNSTGSSLNQYSSGMLHGE
ncbi:hypothetical protein ACIP1Z_04480 [Pseudomonas moraviensis]|uniref:hypothetical protein n=1 Tax=Pseudomonas moraviensis TaxID=321662 RepID=UPI00382E39B2